MKRKKCYTCGKTRLVKFFHKRKNCKDGLSSSCKNCISEYYKQYYKDPIKLEKKRKKAKEYAKRPEVKKRKNELKRKYRKTLRHKQKKWEYRRKKRKTDPQYNIKNALRCRLYSAVNGGIRAGSAVKDLGCTVKHLKEYLEKKFKKGMSWDNYGEWHIDHIKPLSKFDLTKREEFLEACHYTNLQPLWGIDNIKKGAKWEEDE